jgi:hypothetical protein
MTEMMSALEWLGFADTSLDERGNLYCKKSTSGGCAPSPGYR